jgi:Sec-independent protein translocase protein TatA
MDILGIGPLELIFIIIIALIVLGPKDMVKAGRSIGKFLRQVVTSSTWRAVTQTSNELRTLPNKLIREAGLEEELKDIQNATQEVLPKNLNSDLSQWKQDISSWTTPPTIGTPPPEADSPAGDSTSATETPIEEE